MTKFSHIALATAILVAGASVAEAGWKRNANGTGPRGGTWSSSGSGSCSGGTCSSTQRFTGPAGNTYYRNGTTSCSGGTCNSNSSVSGPHGNGYTRSGTITRN